MRIPENLEIAIKSYRNWSRNSGPGVSSHRGSVLVPENMDTVYRIIDPTEMVYGFKKFLLTAFFIKQRFCANSRKSEKCRQHLTEILFDWSRNSGPGVFISHRFVLVPGNLDNVLRILPRCCMALEIPITSYRKSV